MLSFYAKIKGMSESRTCSRCKLIKAIFEFSTKDRYCRECRNEYTRQYNKRRPDVIKRAKAKYMAKLTDDQRYRRNRTAMLWRFKLTDAMWDDMFDSQGRRCAICRVDTPTGHGWHVDHDHVCCPENGRSCGKCVRAILCSECNTGLGKFRDNPAVLRAAADYIERVREI